MMDRRSVRCFSALSLVLGLGAAAVCEGAPAASKKSQAVHRGAAKRVHSNTAAHPSTRKPPSSEPSTHGAPLRSDPLIPQASAAAPEPPVLFDVVSTRTRDARSGRILSSATTLETPPR